MKSEFKIYDKVIVTRVKPGPEEQRYNSNYPKLGWTGTLGNKFNSYSPHPGNTSWEIKWDKGFNSRNGDLIREWMIEKIVKDWDE